MKKKYGMVYLLSYDIVTIINLSMFRELFKIFTFRENHFDLLRMSFVIFRLQCV